MDIKRRLLEFLYEHKDNGVNIDITPIVEQFDDQRTQLFQVVLNLSTDGLIAPINNAYNITTTRQGKHLLANQLYCKTRITDNGEKYVQENYLERLDNLPNENPNQNNDTVNKEATSINWNVVNAIIAFMSVIVTIFLAFYFSKNK